MEDSYKEELPQHYIPNQQIEDYCMHGSKGASGARLDAQRAQGNAQIPWKSAGNARKV